MCGGIETFRLYRDGVHEDLSGLCCKPLLSERCASLFFDEQQLVPDLISAIKGLISAIERVEVSSTARYGESDFLRVRRGRHAFMLDQLHMHLELLRMAIGKRLRPKCRYYVRASGPYLYVHRKPPGVQFRCEQGQLPYCPRIFNHPDCTEVAHLL